MKTRLELELDAIQDAIQANDAEREKGRPDLAVTSALYIKARLGDRQAIAQYDALVDADRRLSRIGFDLHRQYDDLCLRVAEERRQLKALSTIRATTDQSSIGGILNPRSPDMLVSLSGTLEERIAAVQAQKNAHAAAVQKVRDERQALFDRANNGDTRAIEKYNALIDQERAMASHGFALRTHYDKLMVELSEQRSIERLNRMLER